LMGKIQLRAEAEVNVEVLTERGIWIGHFLSRPRFRPTSELGASAIECN
jgi:hypothetical protein